MRWILLCVLIRVVVNKAETTKSYTNYRVLRINIDDAADRYTILHALAPKADVWSSGLTTATVMLTPGQSEPMLQLLSAHNISHHTITDDLGAIFALERRQQRLAQRLRREQSPSSLPLDYYARHDEINAYLDALAVRYPDAVEVQSAGRSFEGRDLKYVRIMAIKSAVKETANETTTTRTLPPVIFVDAGIHAREWIAPATALYVIHQLVERAAENADLRNGIEWRVWPTVNADGYEYSHRADRMWRKTRQPNAANARCPGTDGNRNFDYKWGVVGASPSPCSETFRGATAFSEPETRAVREIMRDLGERCRLYLTLHSFGNMLLYPWGYTTELPATWRDMDEVASAGAAAIREATGAAYSVGSSTNVLYAAAGGSDDYAHGVHRIPVALTMELPGGRFGFDVPAAQIAASVEESWVGIRAMARKVIEKYAR